MLSVLALDASPRVRLAAAASVATLLEGLAQAAFLGLAEVAPGNRTARCAYVCLAVVDAWRSIVPWRHWGMPASTPTLQAMQHATPAAGPDLFVLLAASPAILSPEFAPEPDPPALAHLHSFISLSERIGHLVTHLHSQLLAALASETQARVRAGTLRALGTLAVGTPYARMPATLACDMLKVC